MVRPITLWPFPSQAVLDAVAQPSVKKALAVEISAGQMVEDARLAVNGLKEVADVYKRQVFAKGRKRLGRWASICRSIAAVSYTHLSGH